MAKRQTLSTIAALAVVYLAVAVFWMRPASTSPIDTVPNLGDPLHMAWILAWQAHQLVREPWALFDANAFYPQTRSLAFSNHSFSAAIVAAPFFWTTGEAIFAMNACLMLTPALSALAMLALLRSAGVSPAAAFVAGALYGFNRYSGSALTTANMLSIEWWPLALAFLLRLARRGRAPDAALFVAALLLQGLAYNYYLVYTALLAPVWLACAYAAARRWPEREERRALLVWGALAALAAALFVLPYVINLGQMGALHRGPEGGSRFGLAGLEEYTGQLGGVAHVLAGAGLVQALRRRSLALFGGLPAIALATIAIGLLLPLVAAFRLVGDVDVGGRTPVLILFSECALAGLGANWVLARFGGGRAALAAAAMAAVALAQQWTAPAPGVKAPAGRALPSVYRWLASDSREPLVELPLYPDLAKRLWALYPYLSTYHFRPVPIGRSSIYPPAHDYLAYSLGRFPDATSIGLLDRLGIRTVVVHPLLWSEEERVERLRALDAEPRLRLARTFENEPPSSLAPLRFGHERVYRIVGAELAGPAPCAPGDELPHSGWTLRGSGGHPGRASDGDLQTAWHTEGSQRAGDFFRISFPRKERIAAVVLAMDYYGFPRDITLQVRDEDGEMRSVAYQDGAEERWQTIRDLLERPREARLVLRFRPERASAVRLVIAFQGDFNALPPWAIPEIRIYRECAPP